MLGEDLMTTIIIDVQNKSLYTDSRATHQPTTVKLFGKRIFKRGKEYFTDTENKVFHSTRERIITGSGDVQLIERYRDYLLGKRRLKPKLINTTVYDIIISPNFKVMCNDSGEISECTGEVHTSGSGGEFAAGAIAARQLKLDRAFVAIEAAIQLDRYSGGSIVKYDLTGRWYDEDKC